MAGTPREALRQLRRDAREGRLAQLCDAAGIELLVAFGSATDPGWPRPPRDLDVAVRLFRDADLLGVVDALTTHLGSDQIDVMDLNRAGTVARTQALGRGELLYEARPGIFAEQQMIAVAQSADTRWMRELQLEALAR